MKVYVFGNEFLEQDSLAKGIVREINLAGIEFVNCDGPEEIFLEQEQIVILDVAKDLKEVVLIDDINRLQSSKLYSLHDFDLTYFLKLMKETKQLNTVKIIAIPMSGNKEKIKNQVVKIIKSLSN